MPRLSRSQLFDRTLKGKRAWTVVDGDSGRLELCQYIKKYNGRVGLYTQETLDELEIDLDLLTDVLSTQGGAIFELFIHGATTLIILRPSTGSFAFNEQRKCERQLQLLFKTLHNQQLVLGKMMLVDIPKFKVATSPLATLFTTAGVRAACGNRARCA